MNKKDWQEGFPMFFSLVSGMSPQQRPTQRKLSQMRGMYHDTAAVDEVLSHHDPVIYEFYELEAPDHSGDLAFGTSIVHPGKVGNEFFMTKGHFHGVLDTAEVYYTLSGEGYMLTENPEGDVKLFPLEPGKAVYVPKRYAHRSINTGSMPLITFFVFRADAGHDYGTIENKGFRKLLVEGNDGKPSLIDNPKWAVAR